jgi:hypothetical protein
MGLQVKFRIENPMASRCFGYEQELGGDVTQTNLTTLGMKTIDVCSRSVQRKSGALKLTYLTLHRKSVLGLAARFLAALIVMHGLAAPRASAQSDPGRVAKVLDRDIRPLSDTILEMREYLIRKAPQLPSPSTAIEWDVAAKGLRQRLLSDIVYHGWPKAWINAPLHVDELPGASNGNGYRMRKVVIEVLPGLKEPAVVYEPIALHGRVPAILNLNGHGSADGKAAEFKQKRCINQARNGILSLNLEWIGFGELSAKENAHWSYGGYLDLAGANTVGLFYLAMRKGLDYLAQDSRVDIHRIGVTGLSGGGWQTVFLSSLDDRIRAAVPVAGFASFVSRVERIEDIGDIEQNPTDVLTIADYPVLLALRSPRPTLLIYNVNDDCCYRAPLVKPYIFDRVKSFFQLYNAEDQLQWHDNLYPGDHNYQAENRIHSYTFFANAFALPPVFKESSADSEVRTPEELAVGVPKDNLTVLGVAKRLAAMVIRDPVPADTSSRVQWASKKRAELRRTVRYAAVAVDHAWALENDTEKGIDSRWYRVRFNDGLSVAAARVKSTSSTVENIAIVLNDAGSRGASAVVSDYVNRGRETLAADLLFTENRERSSRELRRFGQLFASVGDRPVGIEAAQLLAVAQWLRKEHPGAPITLDCTGVRSEVIASVAAAIVPGLFSELVIRNGIRSLAELFAGEIDYQDAPDLFCLDLFKNFDLEQLGALAGSTSFRWMLTEIVRK